MPTLTLPFAPPVPVVQCDGCGVETGRTTVTVDGSEVCAGCLTGYEKCDRCGEYASSLTETDISRSVCDECAYGMSTCVECDTLSEDSRSTDSGGEVCDPCSDAYWSCENCYVLTRNGDYCESCEPEQADGGSDYVHCYDYRPAPEFHGTGPLYLGVELEINTPDLGYCAETATDHLGSVGYLKEDCSIGRGFEIVTHPMSYDWAMGHFPWGMLDELAALGASGDGNGLHVHVSRAAFDEPAHVFRWLKLIYRNQTEVIGIARRESNQWAPFSPEGRRYAKHAAKGGKCTNRYQAINVQNEHTFELRIFAGTVNKTEVKAALALAAASVEYTRALAVRDIVDGKGWEWETFAAWVAGQGIYPDLASEMEALACAC